MSCPAKKLLCGVLLCATACLPVPVHAQGFPAITYELQEGSILIDDCLCDRVTIEVPIEGKIVLRRLPVRILGELYDIEEVQILGAGNAFGPYVVTGTGSFYRRASEPDVQNMSITATVNGVPDIEIKAEQVEAKAQWPRIEIQIDEGREPVRDPLHIYSLRIVAKPVSQTWRYEVIEGSRETFEGSFFYDDCDICGRPTIPIPVKGSFLLTDALGDEANPVQHFTVEAFALRTIDETFQYQVDGAGDYEQGGEVALLQSMDLLVAVNKEPDVKLSSGKVSVPEGVQLPEIRIRLEQTNAPSPVHVYRLDLWARPSTAPPPQEFLRGDANADGTGDISDAVFILLWRFAGGAPPPCLDAADVNLDSLHDLSDAVYLLLHLFQGGEAPPPPGLSQCGAPEKVVFGCEAYPCP